MGLATRRPSPLGMGFNGRWATNRRWWKAAGVRPEGRRRCHEHEGASERYCCGATIDNSDATRAALRMRPFVLFQKMRHYCTTKRHPHSHPKRTEGNNLKSSKTNLNCQLILVAGR